MSSTVWLALAALAAGQATPAATVAPVPAPAVQTAPLAPFAGTWTGTGTYLQRPASFRLTFAPALNGRFWTLDLRAQPAGAPLLEGKAFYRLRGGRLDGGTWVDSQGNLFALTPKLEAPGALAVDIGGFARSHFRVRPDGRLEMVECVGPGATCGTVARAELSRTTS